MSDIITYDEEGLPIPDGGERYSTQEELFGTEPMFDPSELEDGVSIFEAMGHPELEPSPEDIVAAEKRIKAAQFLEELREKQENGGAWGDLGGVSVGQHVRQERAQNNSFEPEEQEEDFILSRPKREDESWPDYIRDITGIGRNSLENQ